MTIVGVGLQHKFHLFFVQRQKRFNVNYILSVLTTRDRQIEKQAFNEVGHCESRLDDLRLANIH